MLMMKNLGAIFSARVARALSTALAVAVAATWPMASSAAAVEEKKRIFVGGRW